MNKALLLTATLGLWNNSSTHS